MNAKTVFSLFIFNIIWILILLSMTVIIFLMLRTFVWLSFGGDFLFSLEDIRRAYRISLFAGHICGSGSWFIYYRHYRHYRHYK